MSEDLRIGRKIQAAGTERLALTFAAACSVAMSGGVIAALVYLFLALVPPLAARPAFRQSPSAGVGALLWAVIEKKELGNDVKSATDIHRNIAADTSAPREVRVTAMLGLAGYKGKLGAPRHTDC